MIVYHYDSNTILQASFHSRSKNDCIPAFNSIMERLRQRGHKVYHHIMDIEFSADFKQVITEHWKATVQLFPPDMHRRKISERTICTFKAHFLAILSGVDSDFPRYLWDTLLPQTKITLNILCRSTLNPHISAWEHFSSAFDFAATPMIPMGCQFIIHNKPPKRKYWNQ